MTQKKWLNKIIIYLSSPLLFIFYKLIYSTYRWEINGPLPKERHRLPALWVTFHQRFFFFGGFLAPLNLTVIISESDDGQLGARVSKWLGWKYIIGSAGRANALKATRSLIKIIKKGGSAALLLDGPLGPPRQVKKGVITIASLTGAPIIPISCGASRYWEFNSWDRYRLPKPFAKISVEILAAMHIPPHLDANRLEQYRKELEQKLIALDEALDKGQLSD